MNKLYSKLMAVSMISSTTLLAAENSPNVETELKPLNAEFLLFIAEMEKTEDDWLDPIAVEKMAIEKMDINEIDSEKKMTQPEAQNLINQTDEIPSREGVK